MSWFRRPKISVVVVVYRMLREAPRTLYSLSKRYQRGIADHDYEVVVVENSSDQMLTSKTVESFGPQFRYIQNPQRSLSPASALNLGARQARGNTLLMMVDGARIASPGILYFTLLAHRLYDRPVVATLGWHLGPDNQARSIHQGYSRAVEDDLLAKSGWASDGYQLFTISSLAGSCATGWFSPIRESNCLALDRRHYWSLGGFDEAFESDGGGFVNLDFYARAVADQNRKLVVLLGEGTFHQVHGGAATNRQNNEPIAKFQQEYQRLRGSPFKVPRTEPIFLGAMPEQAKSFVGTLTAPSPRPQPSSADSAPAQSVSAGVTMNAKRSSSQVVTVLGMHRSGTSCLAGTLMECGVDFGEVSRQNRFNQKGNNENQQIMDLHDSLLTESGGSWKEPPADVRWNSRHYGERDAIVALFRQGNSPRWGFKDPRTLLVIDGWLDALPDMQIVGIFRHPDAVAQSLTNRNLFSRAKGHDLWCHYNRLLLALYRVRPFPVLYFSEEPESFRKQLENVIPLLGLNSPAQGFEFFDPALQHFEASANDELPAQVAQLYAELHSIAFYHPENQARFARNRAAA